MHELKNSDRVKETIILVGAIMKKHAEPSLEHENALMNPKLIENVAPQLRPFVEDHIKICKVLDSAKGTIKKETVEAVLQVVGEEIDHHFVAEEELLFPRMGKHVGGTDVGPVARLIEEHHKIRNLYRELQETFDVFVKQDSERTRTSLNEKMEELFITLLNHLGKEDSHIFPMASRLLTEDEKNAVAEGLLQYK
jgi:hemerythrin-like domain-containing protein